MSDTPITKLSGLDITTDANSKFNGLYVPQLTTTERNNISPEILRNGAIIYNTDNINFEVYEDNRWKTLSYVATELGKGEDGKMKISSPAFVIPSGPKGNVEKVENQKEGFVYYDRTDKQLKIYANNAWRVITAN